MIERYLNERIWSKMATQDEWCVKGFICGVTLAPFIVWRIMK